MDQNIARVSSSSQISDDFRPTRVVKVEICREKVADLLNLHGKVAIGGLKQQIMMNVEAELDLVLGPD